jgi:hypothetical protein
MGMTCTLSRVNETDLLRLRETPEQVSTFLYGEPPQLETVREPGLLGLFMRLFGITDQQVRATATADKPGNSTVQQIQEDDQIDIDKAWHGLHFLFTGTAWKGDEPGCFLLCGGEEIGDEDVGPARALSPDHVSQFATFLVELSHDELARRYSPPRMTALEIYPDVIWTRPAAPGESAFDYLFEAFEKLRDFVTATATKREWLIVSVV